MRIAQVAPLFECVPPKLYGGTERVVAYLTDELVTRGHDVTLFASGDSSTSARLVACCERATRLNPDCVDEIALSVLQLETVAQQADQFDLIHYHVDYHHFPLTRRLLTPSLTTLHGRLDIPELKPLYREFSELPLVAISDAQRIPLSFANWQATVYHGLPDNLLQFCPTPKGYLAFVGRMSPEKRCDRAIEIAKAVNLPLRIAAKISKQDEEYFRAEIEPLLGHPLVEFIGEISDADKSAFIGNAVATLFPIDWAEPFGLVMIESLACGTPVVAFGQGSVPEIIADGKTGFVVHSTAEAIAAVGRLAHIDRRACRREFETRFSARQMTEDYLAVYRRLLCPERTDGPTSEFPEFVDQVGA